MAVGRHVWACRRTLKRRVLASSSVFVRNDALNRGGSHISFIPIVIIIVLRSSLWSVPDALFLKL